MENSTEIPLKLGIKLLYTLLFIDFTLAKLGMGRKKSQIIAIPLTFIHWHKSSFTHKKNNDS